MGRGRRIAAALGLLVAVSTEPCLAHGPDTAGAIAIGAAALLVPCDTGVAVPADGSAPRFVLGWSWQLPVSALIQEENLRHRIVLGVDWLPQVDSAWRGRAGYRYGRRTLFGGAGVGFGGAGTSLSPELGVKFLHLEDSEPKNPIDASLHVLARADIAPDLGGVRGATLLVGWNLF
jgi:hypothetical protein